MAEKPVIYNSPLGMGNNPPLGRGKGNHAAGPNHYRWRGGNPKPDPERRRANAKASSARYPERRRARERLKDAVRSGAIPPIQYQSCVDCGGSAQRYDHFNGYENALDVQPVCCKCDGVRSKNRGEHKLRGRIRVTPSLKSNGATVTVPNA